MKIEKMKQHITLEQWLELSKNKREKFCIILNIRRVAEIGMPIRKITIGMMIEFLGDDWVEVFRDTFDNSVNGERPCDALWEAVKFKLYQK